MGLDNDARGWIMSVVSGIASIICVDLIIRHIPGQKNFKIEDSNAFLSSGLSLSFGVMIFSSLYSMLPSSKKYLTDGGMTPRAATFTMIGCFLIGALGIAVLSRILHQYIPHAVVDCDHEHDDEEEGKLDDHHHHHDHETEEIGPFRRRDTPAPDSSDETGFQSYSDYGSTAQAPPVGPPQRRPSLHSQISSKVTELVTGSKEFCDDQGRCFGFSNPCSAECFRNVQKTRAPSAVAGFSSRPSFGPRSKTSDERHPLLQDIEETSPLATQSGPANLQNQSEAHTNGHLYSHHTLTKTPSSQSISTIHTSSSHSSHSHTKPHHHHVPTNVFLSIGLQTSIAIALHKIPEGFITYATNHANPKLGVSIFLALFIHNITEGFAMALPLYLAINSRWKAMFVSAILGGVSQPLGAGVAALWFRIARRGSENGGGEPGETAYGVLFAITAGIMAMVGLQLFGEALDLTHSRKLCFVGAFVGMGVLGCSSALTA
ncbi:Zinc/iron permease [Amniculicola lignicola CBS 123094]|uniref:Zinc/iron permease n=1 Tax=Amniculicola lignicola CBS 123094 TaxID=1392246 RepID=A0A6A5WPY8_9PLEO|nr:Zinc/iron permease [Amniculicola lignicola CBS 123094]